MVVLRRIRAKQGALLANGSQLLENTSPQTPRAKLLAHSHDSPPPKRARREGESPCQECEKREDQNSVDADRPWTSMSQPSGISEQESSYPLIGRQKECAELDGFLRGALARDIDLRKPGGGSLYVSGGPGTGKTCTVRAASRNWKMNFDAQTVIMEVNCMQLTQRSASGLLMKLAEMAEGMPANDPCDCAAPPLRRGGTNSSVLAAVTARLARLGRSIIIIADEVDQLINRRSLGANPGLEAVLALNSAVGGPTIAFIAIANAVDLLERCPLLNTRDTATHCESLLFEPYTADQLRAILKVRLAAAGDAGDAAQKVLGPVGIELRVRQVAKRSGDCRQLVGICEQALFAVASAVTSECQDEGRTGAEANDTTVNPSVPAPDGQPVLEATTPIRSTKGLSTPVKTPRLLRTVNDPLATLGQTPLQHQVLLCALANAKGEAMEFLDVCQRYKDLCCKQLHLTSGQASKDQVRSILSMLEQRGLLSLRTVRRNGTPGRGRRATSSTNSDSVVELAVSCKAVKESLLKANPMLDRCLN